MVAAATLFAVYAVLLKRAKFELPRIPLLLKRDTMDHWRRGERTEIFWVITAVWVLILAIILCVLVFEV
jgi:hypothetical protein